MIFILGIFRKRKLIGDWEKSRTVLENSGADLILYNVVNAFKFPDNAQVYITCNVEVGHIRHFINRTLFLKIFGPASMPQRCRRCSAKFCVKMTNTQKYIKETLTNICTKNQNDGLEYH